MCRPLPAGNAAAAPLLILLHLGLTAAQPSSQRNFRDELLIS